MKTYVTAAVVMLVAIAIANRIPSLAGIINPTLATTA